jgi:hypothetical protein
MQFLLVTVVPKYFFFAQFAINLLAIFILWFCQLLLREFSYVLAGYLAISDTV